MIIRIAFLVFLVSALVFVHGQDPLQNAGLYANQMFDTARVNVFADEAASDPIVMYTDGVLKLWVENQLVAAVPVIPPVYSTLQAVNSIPYGVFWALERSARKGSPILATAVNTLITRITAAEGSLNQYSWSATQRDRAATILSESKGMLNEAVTEGYVSHSQLNLFTRTVLPLMQMNYNDSAIALLNTIHAQMMLWKTEAIDSDAWGRMYVVVRGSHMHRPREIVTSYYNRLLNTSLGAHVVYAEEIAEAPAMELLSRHMIDFNAGLSFYNDGLATHEDPMGVYGSAYIASLLRYIGQGSGDGENGDGEPIPNNPGTSTSGVNLGFLFIGLFAALLAIVIVGRFMVAVRDYKPLPKA